MAHTRHLEDRYTCDRCGAKAVVKPEFVDLRATLRGWVRLTLMDSVNLPVVDDGKSIKWSYEFCHDCRGVVRQAVASLIAAHEGEQGDDDAGLSQQTPG